MGAPRAQHPHVILDPDWTITAHNEAAALRFGRKGECLAGQNLRSILLSMNAGWASRLSGGPSDLLRNGNLPDGFRASGIEIPNTNGACSLLFEPCGRICRASADDGRGVAVSTDPRAIPVGKFLPLLDGRVVVYRQDADLRRTERLGGGIDPSVEGWDFRERVHPEDRGRFERAVRAARAAGGELIRIAYRLLSPEGTVRHVLDFRRAVFGGDGRAPVAYDGFLLDRTQEVLTDWRLRRAGWHENLFMAMRVLLHDFNNAVTGMYLLLESVAPGEEEGEIFLATRERTERAAELAGRITRLQERKVGAVGPCCLAALVREQENLLRTCLPNGVQFELDVGEGSFETRLDIVSLQAILCSFALNARDALGHGGRVAVALRRVPLSTRPESGVVFCAAAGSGDGAEFLFTDNGCGIEPDALPRIVDPHYSTHPRNHGAGLGLFNVKRVAEANGFGFSAVSEVGVGTTMRLLIPLDGSPAGGAEGDRRIALVWRDPAAEGNLASHLKSAGWEIRFFGTPADGERLLDGTGGRARMILIESGFGNGSGRLPSALVDWLAGCSGNVRRVLRVTGGDPDRLGLDLRALFDLVLDGNRGAEEEVSILLRELG